MPYQILAIIIWSSAFIAAKYTHDMIDTVLMLQIRMILAAGAVLPVCRRHLGSIPEDKWRPLLLLSFINYVVVLMLQFVGLEYTSAASAATMIGLEPLVIVFVGHFFFNDRAQNYHWLCGLAAFIGVGILIYGGGGGGGEIGLFGCLLVFLGGVAFCGSLRPTQKLIADIGAPAYTSVSLLLAALMYLPVSLLFAENYTVNWSWQGGISLLYLGIGCGWFAYWLWNKGMGSVSANLSGLLTSLEPIFGVLFAMWFLDEKISPVSGLGMTLVIAATAAAGIIPRLRQKRQTA